MSGRVALGLLGLLGLLGGCSSHRAAARLEGRYDAGEPGEGWREVEPGGADKAWYNAVLSSSIYTDSNCGPRFTEARVEDLATELIAGLRSVELLREAPRALAGREGIERTVRARLDGVPVQVTVIVLNKGACTYDFTLVSTPEAAEKAQPGLERVVKGFETR